MPFILFTSFCILNTYLKSIEPATFVEKLEPSQLLRKGDYAQLDCKVIGTPQIKITWFKDDREIQESAKYKMSFVGSKAMLKVIGVEIEDSGEYICEAKNDAGKDICSSVVTVKGLCQISPAPIPFSKFVASLKGSSA